MKWTFIILFFVGLHSGFAQSLRLTQPWDSLARLAIQWTAEQRYDAVLQLKDPLGRSDASIHVFKAMAALARADDLHHKPSLDIAQKQLESAQKVLAQNSQHSHRDFWLAMVELQRGYVLVAQGNSVRGAMASRSGALDMSEILANTDARGFAAIYEYYKSRILGKMLTGTGDQQAKLQLQRSLQESLYFQAIFANALAWIEFDLGNFETTEQIAQNQLKRYPQHRVFRQMLGDAQRRAKKWSLAQHSYLQSLKQYESVAKGSVRYVSALGNLLLISKALNDANGIKQYNQLYKLYEPKVRSQMPKSLVEELQRQKLPF